MSLRLEMLQVARLSPKQLGDARDLVQRFLFEQRHPDGGFQDRAGQSDIYYTVFGLEGLVALQADPPVEETTAYLRRFGGGESLDFVHVACLARAWATLSQSRSLSFPREGGGSVPEAKEFPPDDRGDGGRRGVANAAGSLEERRASDAVRGAIARRLEAFRSADGGYHQTPGAPRGTIYAAFLALGAYQDLQRALPDPERLLASVASLRARDGGYANHAESPVGLTTSTAAAVAIHRQLDRPIAGDPGGWLMARYHAQGGFTASPMTPMPDLLSTATALHALASLHAPMAQLQDSCLDFIDTLWTNRGGFYGSWADDRVDCEYTYYGLLALGHLTL